MWKVGGQGAGESVCGSWAFCVKTRSLTRPELNRFVAEVKRRVKIEEEKDD